MATVQVERVGDVAVVVAEGRFVGNREIEALDQTLRDLLASPENTKILVDLSKTPLMSSMALGVLIKTQRAASEAQRRFVLSGAHTRLRAVIERCFGSVLPLFDDREAALQFLQPT